MHTKLKFQSSFIFFNCFTWTHLYFQNKTTICNDQFKRCSRAPHDSARYYMTWQKRKLSISPKSKSNVRKWLKHINKTNRTKKRRGNTFLTVCLWFKSGPVKNPHTSRGCPQMTFLKDGWLICFSLRPINVLGNNSFASWRQKNRKAWINWPLQQSPDECMGWFPPVFFP